MVEFLCDKSRIEVFKEKIEKVQFNAIVVIKKAKPETFREILFEELGLESLNEGSKMASYFVIF